jgi:hypothetical protein
MMGSVADEFQDYFDIRVDAFLALGVLVHDPRLMTGELITSPERPA